MDQQRPHRDYAAQSNQGFNGRCAVENPGSQGRSARSSGRCPAQLSMDHCLYKNRRDAAEARTSGIGRLQARERRELRPSSTTDPSRARRGEREAGGPCPGARRRASWRAGIVEPRRVERHRVSAQGLRSDRRKPRITSDPGHRWFGQKRRAPSLERRTGDTPSARWRARCGRCRPKSPRSAGHTAGACDPRADSASARDGPWVSRRPRLIARSRTRTKEAERLASARKCPAPATVVPAPDRTPVRRDPHRARRTRDRIAVCDRPSPVTQIDGVPDACSRKDQPSLAAGGLRQMDSSGLSALHSGVMPERVKSKCLFRIAHQRNIFLTHLSTLRSQFV